MLRFAARIRPQRPQIIDLDTAVDFLLLAGGHLRRGEVPVFVVRPQVGTGIEDIYKEELEGDYDGMFVGAQEIIEAANALYQRLVREIDRADAAKWDEDVTRDRERLIADGVEEWNKVNLYQIDTNLANLAEHMLEGYGIPYNNLTYEQFREAILRWPTEHA